MGECFLNPLDLTNITSKLDLANGRIEGGSYREVRLSHLKDYCGDESAVKKVLATDDPVVYQVSSLEPASKEGDLHYGLGTLMPGKVGEEYYFTKGHYHSFRPAAEIYIGLEGSGLMLLEEEESGATKLVALGKNSVVYVPGYTAHRTINTGKVPLQYLGIYPANAGHDYGAIAERNFLTMVVEQAGRPTLVDRKEFLGA